MTNHLTDEAVKALLDGVSDGKHWVKSGRALQELQSAAPDLARALLATRAELAATKQREARRSFPILKGEGAKIDYQLVSDHAEQARSNHYQSVERLAERGGLSWCELYAVLHNRKWEKIDNNEAMIACRALEARYLVALSSRPDGGEAPEIGKVKP